MDVNLLIIFSAVIIMLGMVLAFFFGLIWFSMGRKQSRVAGREEAQSLQEFNRLLTNMERRIESLETLLVEGAARSGAKSRSEIE